MRADVALRSRNARRWIFWTASSAWSARRAPGGLLDIDEFQYHARPDWAFYDGYRKLIVDIKKEVSPSLTPNNAAATGFSMATMQ